LAGYGWAIFTSVNGVEIFWEQLGNAGLDAGLFQGVRTAAIGPATAGALRERGLEPDFMPEKFTGEEIVAGLGDVSGLRVLLPRGELARKNLAELLTAWGAIVDEVVIYRTLPAEIHPSALAELQRGVHVITFTSGSTARNFVTAIQASGQLPALFDNTLIACIGPVSADEARQLGLEVGLVAGEHTTDGLVQALSSHFGF
jgi:uroporphyrinogen-III synthase